MCFTMGSLSSAMAGGAGAIIDDIFYAFNVEAHTAEVIRPMTEMTAVFLPDAFTYGGQVYTVTSISDEAFYACDAITTLHLPESLTRIGSFAFGCCSGLTTVKIPKNVTFINYFAFEGCDNLESVYSYSTVPPTASYAPFGEEPTATLYVPSGCKSAYATAEGWKLFTNIVEMAPTAIKSVDGAPEANSTAKHKKVLKNGRLIIDGKYNAAGQRVK